MKTAIPSIILILTVMYPGLAALPGEDDSSVVFYLPFDNRTVAEIGAHPEATVHEGEPEYAPGQRGSAMVAGDGKSHLTFDAANIPAREGTLEFWFKPLNWNGLDTNTFHVFVETDPDQQKHFFLVYKYYNAQNAGFIWENGGSIFQRKIRGWEGWVHYAVTWSPTGCRMYFNGVPSAVTVPKDPPSKYVGRMIVGDRPWQFKRDEQTLIDELYIYNRAFEPEEITWAMENIATRPRGKDVPTGLVPTKVHAKILPLKRKIIAQVYHESTVAMQHASATAQLLGPTPLAPVSLTDNEATLSFDKLQTGDYTLAVKFMDAGGKVVDHAADKFFCPDNSWLGNTIGINDVPPPPWTPIEVTDRTLKCWGRTYRLADSGLPEMIEATGSPLLAGPVELAGSWPWRYGEPKLMRESAVEVEYQGKWTSHIGELHWQAVAEYDGLFKYTFTLNPSPRAELDLLELRFPLRADAATIANCLTNTGSIMGQTPDGYRSTGARQWWLGNEQRGLAAFRSSDEAWDRLDRDGGFRIERNGDTVTVVWSFIGSKMKLTKPWRFTFGMTATPVRHTIGRRGRPSRVMPMNRWLIPRPQVQRPEGLQDLMANQGIRDEIFSPHIVLWGGGEWRTYAPDWGRPETYRDGHAKLSTKGLSVMTYMMPCEVPESVPEWRYWSEQWSLGEHHGWTDEVWDRTTCVPSWVDYVVAFRMRMLRRYKFGGYYIDNSSARYGRNANAGFGYERDGRIIPTYNYFGLRKLYKRLYTAVNQYESEHGKPTMIMGHVSGELPLAFLGFLDNRLDGEQFLGPVRIEKKSYHDLISLEKWRATNLSANMGSMAVFLPEFAEEDCVTPDKTRSLLGLLMLHDMVGAYFTDGNQANTAAAVNMWRMQDRFSIENAVVQPYWSNTDVIAGQTDTLKVTAYRQPGGGALIVVANIDKQPVTTDLQIDWSRLRSKGKLKVTDAESDAPVTVQGNHLRLDIPGRNHRVIVCN